MFGEIDNILLRMDEFLARFIDYLNMKHRGFKNEKCKEMWREYDDDMNECMLFFEIHNCSH